MNNKIAIKLFLYFSVALLLFALVIGGVFFTLFRSHTMDMHKAELERSANSIASALSDVYDTSQYPDIWMGMGMGNNMTSGRQKAYLAAYLRLMDQITVSDIWVVDENLELLTVRQMGRSPWQYTDFPEDAEILVEQVFQGKTTFSESFSNLMNTPSLTVGTPIVSGKRVVGALLLHSPIEGMKDAILNGLRILAISVAIALLLAVFLSIYLSLSFTGPLNKMKKAALSLATGDYTVRTKVGQKDEIGELAKAIDVLSHRLDIASRESEKLDQLRRSFTANISHELRTPVTVIRGSLEALCDGVVTDPVQVESYHRQMLSESIYLQRLVNDLLDLSRLQNTDFQMEREELCIGDVLEDAIRSASRMAQDKKVEIRLEMDSRNCNVTADYGRLRQMFMIVLDNAVKFSPQNGQVTVTQKDQMISIADQGPGIPEEDLPYIFDRFYKSRSEDNKTGTGLGLSIAKQIAERHNIKIFVVNNTPGGAKFQFELSTLEIDSAVNW